MRVLWATNAWGKLEINSISNTIVMENLLQRGSKASAGRSFGSKEQLKGRLASIG